MVPGKVTSEEVCLVQKVVPDLKNDRENAILPMSNRAITYILAHKKGIVPVIL